MLVREADLVREREGGGTWIARHWKHAAQALCVIALGVVVYLAFLQPSEPVHLSGIDANGGKQESGGEAPEDRNGRPGGEAPESRNERPGGTSPAGSQYTSSVERILDMLSSRPR